MTYREPLTPVPYARRTEPSESLADGMAYTPAVSTNIRDLFARVKEETRVPVKPSFRQVAPAGRKAA